MAESVLLGLNGEPNIYECAFVASEVSSRSITLIAIYHIQLSLT